MMSATLPANRIFDVVVPQDLPKLVAKLLKLGSIFILDLASQPLVQLNQGGVHGPGVVRDLERRLVLR